MEKQSQPSVVYFCRRITADNLVKVYECLGRKAEGRVAIKLSTGGPATPTTSLLMSSKICTAGKRHHCGM